MLTIRAIFGLSLLAIALVGGGWASWANIRAAQGPKERGFVIRICLLSWLLILSMLGLMYILPSPLRYAAMLFYFVGLPALIYRWSRTHQLIRRLEARTEKGSDRSPA